MKILVHIITLLAFSSILQAQSKASIPYKDGVLSYTTYGKGDPVLIINGGPGIDSAGFGELAQILSENNRSILYDQRGTGASRLNSDASMTIDLMVEDIEILREHLGYEKWFVLGHSFGGMLAYAYAAKYPQRIRGMIQSHSGGIDLQLRNYPGLRDRLNRSQRDELNRLVQKISFGDTLQETRFKRAKLMAIAYLHDTTRTSEVAERLMTVDRNINAQVWSDFNLIHFDVSEEMKNFEKPVLILNGLDEIVHKNIAIHADNILPNSRLVLMENCGHYGWLERPEIYLKEVKEFLKSD
ncbi:alpha/beta fold hydrolase [Christiangramia portivictoriae]|uniref:alpha/beta fold hydrolase n=1 Tax=Christiangramia portivictoriae TaxID=326069 RepID=UPI00040541B7|nr:alpha/beta fold hydrolase [Christiangramia portivictoriae]